MLNKERILTCAHVVSGARTRTGEVTGDLISLSLASEPERQLTGELVLLGSAETPVDDFALIEVMAGLETVRPPSLIDEVTPGHHFDAFGFPVGWERQGNAAHGTIGVVNAVGAVQLIGDASGFPIRAGFSGGAVWDRLAGGVVGIVTGNATESGGNPRVGLMLPIGTVLERLPADYRWQWARCFEQAEFQTLLAELEGPASEARAVTYLGKLLPRFRNDRDDPVGRYWIYQALGTIGSARARAILRAAVDTENHDFARFGAAEALQISAS